ncbi:hypothetical protein Bca4012_082288 [Brassica carinata]
MFPQTLCTRVVLFVNFHGEKTKEKALQLNGTYIGDWKALVKFAPQEEEEEYQVAIHYKRSMYQDLASDKRFFFGVAVWGYDTSLPEDEIESKLRAHFSSCGVITHVHVCLLDKSTNIYFSNEEGEARALDLNGSQVGGFKITTVGVATVRSNPRLGPDDELMVGYSIPAHFVEFAPEINKKLEDYMTEWRAKARRERVKAMDSTSGNGAELESANGSGLTDALPSRPPFIH